MANSIFLGRLNPEQRKALIERLWQAQGGKCFITGKDIDLSLHEGELDIDHVIPLTNGGKDDESNFALTFSSANRSKQGADLNLARINWQFKEMSEKLQHEENRNPNLTDILAKYAKGSYEMTFKIDGDKISFGNYVYVLDSDSKVETPSLTFDDPYLVIKIPISTKLYPNEDFGINLVYEIE